MIRVSEIKLPLDALPFQAPRRLDDTRENKEYEEEPAPQPIHALRDAAAKRLGIDPFSIVDLTVFKRSFDARSRDVLAVFIVDIRLQDEQASQALLMRHHRDSHINATPSMQYIPPTPLTGPPLARPVVIGFGPCGIFAALVLAEAGACPIVLERGPDVRTRTERTWRLWRKEVLDTYANVQFGEGGAGTFSDGKLYSQIRDTRYLGREVLRQLVKHGAPVDILTEAHPHIGTFKLVKIVQSMRERIISLGGEVRFAHQMIGCEWASNTAGDQPHRLSQLHIQVVDTKTSYTLPCTQVIVAPGHSARDTFAMLWEKKLPMEAKSFSIGFRIEHPQTLINAARWGKHATHPALGAADYKLVHHAKNGRTVYSFCMCPGGGVVAATSEENCVVTNGMSQYSRAERNANSGLVVGVDPLDYPIDASYFIAAFGQKKGEVYALEAVNLKACGIVHPLAGINLQRHLERMAFLLGGGDYHAPVQRVGDFLQGCPSRTLGEVQPSYRPGVVPTDLTQLLPVYCTKALQEAITVFGRQIKGYDLPDAILTGVETRTSSPLRIERGKDLQSPHVLGFYPGGEGAGYAGGILSAAIDGIRLAEAVMKHMSS